MPTVPDPRFAQLLEVGLQLSRMAPGEFGDLAVASRILAGIDSFFPGTDPRLGLIDGNRLVCFAPRRTPGRDRPVDLTTVDVSPLLIEWMRLRRDDTGAGAELGLPLGLRESMKLGRPGLRIAPLEGGGSVLGFVGMHAPLLDSAERQALDVLALYAGTVVENVRLYRRIEREAETDGLTEIYNYRYFMRALTHEMDRVRRHGGEVSVVMVDVDNLKEYNDHFGHLGGSAALREIAAILRSGSRTIDVVSKYGGDEFSVLLPGCGAQGALAYCERVRQRVTDHAFEGDAARRLTVSMGLAVFPTEGRDPRDLLRRADGRLYDAKRAGRDRIGATH